MHPQPRLQRRGRFVVSAQSLLRIPCSHPGIKSKPPCPLTYMYVGVLSGLFMWTMRCSDTPPEGANSDHIAPRQKKERSGEWRCTFER